MADLKWLGKLTKAERVDQAKAKMSRVLDHFLYVVELHANNSFVVYSPILAAQIPTSFAANAFTVFQRSMHQIEIVRLCALWDSADPQKENLPTVIELIDDDEIISTLGDVNLNRWTGSLAVTRNLSSDDPEIVKLELQALKEIEQRHGEEQAAKAQTELKRAIADSRAIIASPRLASAMNIRDKHLAHSLEVTRREEKQGPIQQMKYGDETALLNASIPIIESLYCWVNGKGFSIADSQRINHKNAEALWGGCTFRVLR
ncbi:hypothetical protein EDE08_1162 [Bradyrhizobium sp. R2.2-H]|jgi:hypothetical protein|uniref:AbiU2 domain-containing protein n=1 Tax=unclassified Bradyrhizobium TaxID=2631580 RepID=UPI001048BA05|nr:MULTISPECIES: hypothetical protein [unclassified Bradyrhizobium]TCU64352.1 hypothetical protein EDE10_116123 [Bradyrhizobium sp. Y-H1]TCU66264.1 hypothetical protein EDE08_1162 [Bradyrhizobium sp. R2.2-H]